MPTEMSYENPPGGPLTEAAKAKQPAMRQLDEAAGGGEVPAGTPLGGPVFKTNEELNAEKKAAHTDEASAALIAAGWTPPAGGETTAGAAADPSPLS